jgi:hypothetical protein
MVLIMANTRKKVGETINVEDVFPSHNQQITSAPQYNPAEILEEPYDDVTALNNVLSELGEDENNNGFVTVFREQIHPSGKKEDVYIGKMPVTEFSLDNVKGEWGAGRYKISVYRGGSAGLATRKVITIAADPKPVRVMNDAPPSMDITPLVTMMQEGFKQMAGMVAGALASQHPVTQSRAEMLSEMQLMRDMFAPASTATPNYNPLELMKLGMEMAQNSAGGGESTNAWVGKMLDTFGAPIASAVMASMAQPKAAPAASRQVQALAQPVIQQPTEEEPPMNLMIRGYLKMMLNAAIQNEPVETWADNVLNLLPESELPVIENLLRADNWLSVITQHVPQASQHEQWFTNLRNTLLQFIDDDREGLTMPDVTGNTVKHENADATIKPGNIVNPSEAP